MKLKLVLAMLLASILGWVSPSPASAQVVGFCPEMTDSVQRLYSAYFLRAPDQGGFEFWVNEYSTGSRNLRQISQAFEQAPEFVETYGSLSNQEFVELVYANVLERTPDAGGLVFWTGELDSGYPRGAMMIGFSESEEYVQKTGTVRSLAGYGRIYPVGTTWSCGKASGVFEISAPRGPAYVDVLAVNANAESAVILIDTTGDDEVRDFRIFDSGVLASILQTDFAAGSYFLDFAVPSTVPRSYPASTRKLKVQTDLPETHWTVVFYPQVIAGDRPGWDDPGDTPGFLR